MYDYQTERPALFTDDGQKLFIQIRDRVKYLLAEAGAVRIQEAISKSTGINWEMMACLDRMVELGELKELTNGETPGQYRVFVKSWE